MTETTMARIARLRSRDPEAEIVRLEAALADACRVRDQWCAEYTRVRDEVEDLRHRSPVIVGREDARSRH